MILTQIAACSENNVIGTEGDLPWNLPEDMKFFRDTTKGKIIIMGRKTFDSFKGRPLPKRLHIVITRSAYTKDFVKSESSPVVFVTSLEAALTLAQQEIPNWAEEVFIIGGGEIYRQAMPFTNKIYLTRIHRHFEGDTYFPQIDEQLFTLTDQSPRQEPLPFTFLTYLRK